MSEKELVRVSYTWFRGTNTGHYSALFSIRKRKFIKPRIHWGCNGYYEYYVYPGTYVLLEWSYWNKEEPPHTVTASLIKISKDGNVEVLKKAEYAVHDSSELPNEVLRDFLSARPGYHGSPHLDFTKVYPEEVVKDLLERIEKEEHMVAGVEHE